MMEKTNRRVFVKRVSGLALGVSALPLVLKAGEGAKYPKRVLGRTGEKVSLLTTGGSHIGLKSLTGEDSVRLIRASIDHGVNFLDNAWVYQEGRSETYMGKALKDGYRRKVLLMTKFMARNVEDAKRQMETSLQRFDLDSFDLMQFHDIGQGEDDVDRIYDSGLIKWAEEQRSQGIFKYIGFTGHVHPRYHVEMIRRGYPWDTVQMPVNPADFNREISFQKDVLPLALEKNIGVIGMKSNAGGRLARSGAVTAADGLRYAMSLPLATVVSGMDSMEVLEQNLDLFRNFKPMSETEKAELESRTMGQSDSIESYRK